MSSFIVSDETMSNIIYNLYWNHEFKNQYSILERNGYVSPDDFDRLSVELMKMNVEAVKYRHDDDSSWEALCEPVDWSKGYLNKYQALKSMHCLRYQCCEGNIDKTDLYKFLDELIHAWESYIIDGIPEYENAGWDIVKKVD